MTLDGSPSRPPKAAKELQRLRDRSVALEREVEAVEAAAPAVQNALEALRVQLRLAKRRGGAETKNAELAESRERLRKTIQAARARVAEVAESLQGCADEVRQLAEVNAPLPEEEKSQRAHLLARLRGLAGRVDTVKEAMKDR